MQWSEIQSMLNHNPYIGDVIWHHLGDSMWSIRNPLERVRKQQIRYLETHTELIAFRAFDSLDLDQSGYQIGLRQIVKDSRVQQIFKTTEWIDVCFHLYFSLRGVDHPYNRVSAVMGIASDSSPSTIRSTIREISERQNWGDPDHNGRSKNFDLVVKRTQKWSSTVHGTRARQKGFRELVYASTAVELYRFPRNFKP